MSLSRSNLLLVALGAAAAVALWLYLRNRSTPTDDGSDDTGSSDDDGTAPAPAAGGILDTLETAGSRMVNALTSRGYRNNNPGNMKYISGDPFNGQIGSDGVYGIYDTPQNGTRALGHQLMNYANAGANTVSEIISTWAPQKDNNNTAAYIGDVSTQLDVGPDDVIDVGSRLGDLAQAIAKHENGYIDSSYDFQTWANLP